MIVTKSTAVTLIGGGEVTRETFDFCLSYAPNIVAADSGAAFVLNQGYLPIATIGDLDSLSIEHRMQLPQSSVHYIADQDSTDFEKSLRNITAPFILAAGFLGQRMDHALATLSALMCFNRVPCILVGEMDVIFALSAPVDFHLPIGTRLSLFPLATVRGQSRGLRWPIDDLIFSPMGRVGTSNKTTSEIVHLAMDDKGMLCILPNIYIESVLRGLKLIP